jgi:hypothetical protein
LLFKSLRQLLLDLVDFIHLVTCFFLR